MKTLDELLRSFCGNDDGYPEMHTPFEQNGKIIATNTHSLIAIDKSKTNLSYEERLKPNVSKLICCENPISFIFNVDILRADHNIIAEVDRSGIRECPECRGEGVIECMECGHEYDCPKCKGSGEIGEIRLTGKQINDPMQNYIFPIPISVCFAWRILGKLIDVADFYKTNEVKWIKTGIMSDNHFIVGDALILLMPIRMDGCENPTPINIK